VVKYPKPAPEKIPLSKRLIARFIAAPYKDAGPEEGFRERVTIYLVYCNRCRKYFLDYKHGHLSYFECPYCNAKLD
jgi:DNA-directed RNA polymerase subunit RPC12/RpoP